MATKLSDAKLTVRLIEDVELNGRKLGNTNKYEVSGINEVTERILTVSTTEATILVFSSAIGAGTYVAANVKYLRFTNLDDTNFIMLTFKDEDNTEFRMKVDAGHSFIYPGDNSGGVADTIKSAGSALASGLSDLVDITVDTDTASCDVEVFVASA